MNTSNVTIKSYLPQEKRERSKLQQVKDKHRSFTQTNKQGIPKDLNELKLMKYRDHGINFLKEYMDTDKKTTKSKYCKTHHISHNSLNTGLKVLGYTPSGIQNNVLYKPTIKPDRSRPIETKPDQSRPKRTKRDQSKTKGNEIKAGRVYTGHSPESSEMYTNPTGLDLNKVEYEDEEINEIIDNRLTNLSIVNGSDT